MILLNKFASGFGTPVNLCYNYNYMSFRSIFLTKCDFIHI